MFVLGFVLGFFFGGAATYYFCKSNLVISELLDIRSEFKKIHERLIAVIAEWQKKV